MATTKATETKETETKTVETKETTAPKTAPVQATKYTVDELCAASKRAFGVDSIIAVAALKTDGKDAYSEAEAKKIIDNFRNKEVTR